MTRSELISVGEAGLPCGHDGPRSIGEAELGQDGRDVVADGLLGDGQLMGYGGIVKVLAHEGEDLHHGP